MTLFILFNPWIYIEQYENKSLVTERDVTPRAIVYRKILNKNHIGREFLLCYS